MFKHLLVPIVDKEVIKKSVGRIVKLALTDSASITFVHISNPNPPYMYSDDMFGYGISRSNHKKSCKDYANYLFTCALKKVGDDIKADMFHTFSASIYEGILDAAKRTKVDGIVMALHTSEPV